MANDVTLNPGALGAVIITDDVGGGRHSPVSKIMLGVEDADDGYVSSTLPLPIEIGLVDIKTTATSSSAVASAGGTADLDSANIGSSKTGKLLAVVVSSSSASYKVTIKTVLDASETDVFVDFGAPRVVFQPLSKEIYTVVQSASAGFDGFRASIENTDPTLAADFYATFIWDEV